MLTHKYTPSRLIAESERPKIPLVSPRKPTWFRPFFVLMALIRQLLLFLCYLVIHKSHRAEYARQAVKFLQQSGAVWIKTGQLPLFSHNCINRRFNFLQSLLSWSWRMMTNTGS